MNFLIPLLVWLVPHLAFADEVSSKIDRLRTSIMPTAFAIGGLMAVVTLMFGLFSVQIGWSWFMKVLGLVGALCVLNGILSLMTRSLGGVA